MFAGIPVSVASATCYTQDLTVETGGIRPQDTAQSFNLVHVYDDTIVHSVVNIGRANPMRGLSPRRWSGSSKRRASASARAQARYEATKRFRRRQPYALRR